LRQHADCIVIFTAKKEKCGNRNNHQNNANSNDSS
jgi:hypothetical protein